MPKTIPAGPEPVLISRKEVEALYDTLDAVTKALKQLQVQYIVTGGSLLGAIRQHSILFCDDDIDIAIIDDTQDLSVYQKVSDELQGLLGNEYRYLVKPWEGGDKVRPIRMNTVFLDLFVLRRYDNIQELKDVIGVKKNGQPQSQEYVQNIVTKIQQAAFSQCEFNALFPLWHFSTRKAIEMWSKEVYRPNELFPLVNNLRFGPLTDISGPRMPVLLLRRAFGLDCFHVFYQSQSHHQDVKQKINHILDCGGDSNVHNIVSDQKNGLQPLVQKGGTWEGGAKMPLEDEHYLPVQPLSRAKRRYSFHNKETLMNYLENQSRIESKWISENDPSMTVVRRPRRTVYMDGVFDLFHVGHLNAIKECAKLGDRVIIGVTGQDDATSYKRAPIIPEAERVAIVSSLKQVDSVVCPCPLVVTQEFMEKYSIDLVVHGFASEEDEKKQYKFFEYPIQINKFQTIPYHHGTSTTELIHKMMQMAIK